MTCTATVLRVHTYLSGSTGIASLGVVISLKSNVAMLRLYF
jgi:hypothetical protein